MKTQWSQLCVKCTSDNIQQYYYDVSVLSLEWWHIIIRTVLKEQQRVVCHVDLVYFSFAVFVSNFQSLC
jgi:hypothetical protein